MHQRILGLTNGDINCLVRKHFEDVGMDLIKDL